MKLSLLILSLFIVSCVSPALNDDARTVGKGKVWAGTSIGIPYSKVNEDVLDTIFYLDTFRLEDQNIGYIYDRNFTPNANIFTRVGLANKLDFTFRANLSSVVSTGLKYQILGNNNSRFGLSLIGEFGSSLPIHSWKYHYIFGTIFSYYPTNKWAFTISTRFWHNQTTTEFNQYSGESDSLFVSGYEYEYFIIRHLIFNYNISYGDKYKFGLDITHFPLNYPFFKYSAFDLKVFVSLFFRMKLGDFEL
jgi:hypothetical protein